MSGEIDKMMSKEIDDFLQRKAERMRELQDEQKVILEEVTRCLKGRKVKAGYGRNDIYVVENVSGIYLGHYSDSKFSCRAYGRKVIKSGDLGQRMLDFTVNPGKVIDP